MPQARARPAAQPSFAELGTPLHQVTFVVVDLETTGGSPTDCRITEFGAVKIRGGEVLGEFATLVDPGQNIPTGIAALTGITNAMVARYPPVEAVLPAFIEFARGAVLVAHNARFDMGFLNANLTRLDYPRLDQKVICTAALARRLLRDEVRNCRLGTLAAFFATRTQPIHRAMADAKATVEVLHGLLERAGSFGVLTLDDLIDFSKLRNTPVFAARRKMADGLPRLPGVYAFRSKAGEILYVGKATDLRTRVRSYFGNDQRRFVPELLRASDRIDHRICATALEAGVRELRLIHAHQPRFNRQFKRPPPPAWVVLTAEVFPRLSVVRKPPRPGRPALGPLASAKVATRVIAALQEATSVRRCTPRIGPRTRFTPCVLADLGRCGAPCDGRVDTAEYARSIAPLTRALAGDPGDVVARLQARMTELGQTDRFEEAADARDAMSAVVGAVTRTRRIARTVGPSLLAATRATTSRGYEIAVVAHGQLLATAACTADEHDPTMGQIMANVMQRPGHDTDADHSWDGAGGAAGWRTPNGPPAATAAATGQLVLPTAGVAATPSEALLIAAWLDKPGVRIHRCEPGYAEPVAHGLLLAQIAQQITRAQRSTGRAAGELASKRTRRATADV